MSKDAIAAQGPLDRGVRPLVGADDLREWLTEQGFRCAENNLRYLDNRCNWYAYRRSELSARRCECNDDKPGMQIVVTPSEIEVNGNPHRGCEIELCGEAGGVWWKMTAYSLKPEEVPGKLDEVERALISAWNALRPNGELSRAAAGFAGEIGACRRRLGRLVGLPLFKVDLDMDHSANF